VGGPDLPCIGFSTGIERILQTMEGQNISFPEKEGPVVALIPLGEEAKRKTHKLLYALRHAKIATVTIETKKIQKALQQAEQSHALYAVIIGEEELKNNQGQIKIMKTRETENHSLDSLIDYFKKKTKTYGL
jgi:histidyl-tRNA synthetase